MRADRTGWRGQPECAYFGGNTRASMQQAFGYRQRRGAKSPWSAAPSCVPLPKELVFTAEDRKQVEAFYRAALEAGGKDNGAPGLRPHYHANYYAAFVIGPDGHNIEAVCHQPEA